LKWWSIWLLVTSAAPSLAAEPEPPPAASAPASPERPSPDAPPDKETWTWEAFLGHVERHHPLMDAARAGLAQLEAKLSQADWAYFPSFRLEAAATITPKVTGDALASESDWGTIGVYARSKLEMVQPLWTFGKLSSLQRAAEAGVDVGRAAVEVARWELRVRAAEAWMGRLLGKQLDGILADGKTWLDKAEARMERLRAEDSDEYDQLEHLRLKTRSAEFYQLQADNLLLLTQATQGLRLLLGRPPGEEVAIAADAAFEPYEFPLLPVEQYVALASKADPLVELARKSARAQDALADAKAAEAWPDLFFAGQVTLAEATVMEEQDSVFAHDPYHARTVGGVVGLRWKLDVPQRVFQTDEARARARRSASEAEVQADLQEFKVRQLAQELVNKRELLRIFRESQKAAQGWLTATWDTYDAGFGSFRDVMDALVQFYEKKFGYLKLVFEHNLVTWRLSQAVGLDIRGLTSPPQPESP
jgi:outer membrane protein TolC